MTIHFVYAITNENKSRIYVGMTNNVERRVKEHNAGKQRSTKSYRPWHLFHFEAYHSRGEAHKREIYLKSGSGKEFLKDVLKKGAYSSDG